MKLVVFKVDNHTREKRQTGSKLNIERILYISFVITFAILIIAQAALMTPSIRTFLSGNAEFDGKPLQVQEFLYDEGEIGLKLIGIEPDGHVKVLVNGDEVAAFNEDTVNISVRDGDIVEIDGSNLHDSAEVSIVSKSENINEKCANKKLKLEAGVKLLTQIEIE